jgi:hypothetical protein
VLAKVVNVRLRRVLKLSVVILLALDFNKNKDVGLTDFSNYYRANLSVSSRFYEYLSTLPKNALIAAHPYLADPIPTFAQRKVFLNYELSYAWYDKYWETIEARTRELFAAYYSAEFASIYEFANKHQIDYVVVDTRHFSREFLDQSKPYFEPFNTYVRSLSRDSQEYALMKIPESDKLFKDGDVFVISTAALNLK